MGNTVQRREHLARGIAAATLASVISLCGVAGRADAADPPGTIPYDLANFSHPTTIDNPFLPLIPGRQIVLVGLADRGNGGPTNHMVIFTVTDLIKVMPDGLRTVVVWDQDINNGKLRESELALFAQDNAGNVWNLGEYPEEITYPIGAPPVRNAPSTWLHGTRNSSAYAFSRAGIHVQGAPVVGSPVYLSGDAPSIEFLDFAQVASLTASKCAGSVCDDQLLNIDEWDPNQPGDGHQFKYYQRGTGLFRVDPSVDSIEQETLSRTAVNTLTPAELDAARTAAIAIDNRAFANTSSVWFNKPKVVRASTPGAPTTVVAGLGTGGVDVTWSAPVSDGNAVITGYTVTASPGGATRTTTARTATFDGLTRGVEYTFAVTAANIVGSGPAATSNAVLIPDPPTPSSLVSQSPARFLDSRSPGGRTVDGVLAGIGLRAAGSTTEIAVAGRGGVPLDAAAATLNVTVTGAAGAGYLTIWPCGSVMPNASSLNFAAGDTIANSAIVQLGAAGKVCVFTEAATDLIVDVNGYFPAGATFVSQSPARFLDSRSPGGRTVDGVLAGIGLRAAGSTTEIAVAGRGGVPLDAAAATLNVTVTGAAGAGYLTIWPCGSVMPNASSLNFAAGDTIANSAIVQLGAAGKVCVFTESATDLIVDVNGYFPAGATFVSQSPARFLDSRSPGGRTVDGVLAGIGLRAAGSTTEIAVAGRGGVPLDAAAATLNVTVTGAAGAGYLTIWPCGSVMPNASSLNFAAGDTIANSAIVQLGAAGKVCVFTEAATDLIVDVNGYFPA